jgi:hypothetical protein
MVVAFCAGLIHVRTLFELQPSPPGHLYYFRLVTQVLDEPVRRMISWVPTPSALKSTRSARHTCFCEALRFLVLALSGRRSGPVILMEIPARMRQTRTRAD